jgi:hypothetical protein
MNNLHDCVCYSIKSMLMQRKLAVLPLRAMRYNATDCIQIVAFVHMYMYRT